MQTLSDCRCQHHHTVPLLALSHEAQRAKLPLCSPPLPSQTSALPLLNAAFERGSGQTMQSLALPGPTSLLSTPFGRPAEPQEGLAALRAKCSPNRPEQLGYPSPPMSEPHSPSRRSAQSVESARLSYPPLLSTSQRSDGVPPPPPSIYDPRTVQGHAQQRPLYAGEIHHGGQTLHYHPERSSEYSSYGHVPPPPPPPPSYAYGYTNAGLPPYAGAQHGGPVVQQAQMIAPPPARPTKSARRTKAHVASACVNCKKAHLSCDVQRPCGRCVASGKQDTCKDVQHKKRGRPRLRDDREFTRPEERRPSPSHILGAPSASDSFLPRPPYAAPQLQRATDSQRILGGTGYGPGLSSATLHSTTSAAGGQASNVSDYSGAASIHPYGAGPNLAYQQLPVAYLNLDLVIQKSNKAFAELVSFLGDIRGKHLGDLLEVRQNENLQRLRNELREERDEREPTYMAPITPVGQDPMRVVMESVADQDIDRVSHGFTSRSMSLSFRGPGSGPCQSLQVQVRLAKTSLYFVTIVVRSPPRLTAPPLLTQQLAPPTPRHASQTMSAPTMGPATHFTPNQVRPPSAASSAPSSPYFNFSSVRTSLPTFSPSSYSSSPSYSYSPSAADPGYFPTFHAPHPYTRTPSVTSEPNNTFRELNRPTRLEGLHLPPIRTGPPPPPALGSPLHLESGTPAEQQRLRVRPREGSDSAGGAGEQRRDETPDGGKRRRLNIHEVLE